MTRYSILTAVSSKKQAADDKVSLHLQETKSRELAASKGWVETTGPYRIPGASRSFYVNLSDAETDIPQLKQMLDDAEARRFDVLVFYSYDRLGDLADMIAQTLRFYNIQLLSVTQGVELQTPETFDPYLSDSEANMRIMSRMTQQFRIADLRRKYRAGMKKRLDMGLPPLHIPYGYMRPPLQRGDRNAVPIPSPTAPIVVLIKDLFLSGSDYRDIIKQIGAPSPRGNDWHVSTIKSVLLNPFYAGKVSFRRKITQRDARTNSIRLLRNPDPIIKDGAHKPLYSWETFLAIEAEIARRKTLPHNNRFNFSGLLSCSVCGKGIRYDRGAWHCRGHVQISVKEANALIPVKIQQAIRDAKPMASPHSPPVLDSEAWRHGATASELKTLHRQRARIQQAYESEIYSLAEAEQKIKLVDARINELKDKESQTLRRQVDRQQFAQNLQRIKLILDKLPRWIASADHKTVNRALHRLFRTITVTPDCQITVYFRD